MFTLKQGATGFAIVVLLAGFFLLNLFPLPYLNSSSYTNPSAPCSSCSVPPPQQNGPAPPGQPSLVVNSTELNATAGSKVQEYFSVSAPYPMNLTTVGQQGFTVNLAPSSIPSQGNYTDLMIINVASSTSPAAYPFTLEALSGQSVVANQSMVLEVVSSGNQSSNLYFGILHSYNYSITRELIGSGGSVLSTTKLQSVLGSPSLSGVEATFLKYTINITADPISNPPSGSQFFVTFVSLGYSHLSSVPGTTLALGNDGWSLEQYKFTVPISGGATQLYLNTTDSLTGLFYAQHDNSSSSRLGSAWQSAVSEGSIGAESAVAPVSLTIQIVDSNNQLDNISSRFDFVSVPINPTSCGLTTITYPGLAQFPGPSTTTQSQQQTTSQHSASELGVYIQANESSGPAPLTVQFVAFVSGGTGGYSYSWSFGDGATLVRGSNPIASHTYSTTGVYLVQVTVTDGLGDTGGGSFKIDVYSSTWETVVVTACSQSYTGTGGGGQTGNNHVRTLSLIPNAGGLSFFGIGGSAQGIQAWAVDFTQLLGFFGLGAFALDLYAVLRDRARR